MRRSSTPVVGGIAFAAVLLGRLWTVDEYQWIARDDAVITLSHAKNAADFGTIGVSPGGDRVEGFSSPLQFAAAFVIESVSSPGYRVLSILLFVVALAAAGALLVIGLRSHLLSLDLTGRTPDVVALALTLAIAAIVACSWTATGWLGSGMENPLLLVAGVAVVAAALVRNPTRAARALAAIGLLALSVGRVEFAAFTVPLMLATAWVMCSTASDGRRVRAFAEVAVAPLIGCIVVHVGRRLYFGDWLPNTAVVQERSNGLEQMVGLAVILLTATAVIGEAAINEIDSIDVEHRRFAAAVLRSITFVGSGVIVWWSASGRMEAPIQDLALFPPLVPLLVSIAVALQLCRALGLRPWPPNIVFAMLVLVPMAQYVVMGPARLDGYRVLSIVVPFAATWLAALLARIGLSGTPQWSHGGRLPARSMTVSAVAVVVLLAGGTAWSASNDSPRYLNYAISGTDRLLAAADAIRVAELDGTGLPLLANPDLGKVSFAKRAIITDLGLLGDPLLTRIVTERNDLVPQFLTLVAHPDIIEVHGGFSCAYGAWLATPAFGEAHESADEAWSGELDGGGCFLNGRSALWLRNDAADEHELTRAILASDSPAALVAERLEACAAGAGDVFRCEAVRRAVQRATPTLRDQGRLDDVIDQFVSSPSADLARPMLGRGPGWADAAFDAFVELVNRQ